MQCNTSFILTGRARTLMLNGQAVVTQWSEYNLVHIQTQVFTRVSVRSVYATPLKLIDCNSLCSILSHLCQESTYQAAAVAGNMYVKSDEFLHRLIENCHPMSNETHQIIGRTGTNLFLHWFYHEHCCSHCLIHSFLALYSTSGQSTCSLVVSRY